MNSSSNRSTSYNEINIKVSKIYIQLLCINLSRHSSSFWPGRLKPQCNLRTKINNAVTLRRNQRYLRFSCSSMLCLMSHVYDELNVKKFFFVKIKSNTEKQLLHGKDSNCRVLVSEGFETLGGGAYWYLSVITVPTAMWEAVLVI